MLQENFFIFKLSRFFGGTYLRRTSHNRQHPSKHTHTHTLKAQIQAEKVSICT